MGRRAWIALAFATVCTLSAPAAAHATQGDLYAEGTAYRATTYTSHRSVFGACPDTWVVDINANDGDAGRPIYAPEAGSVTVFSTGWGDGYGNSIIWMSADGREQIHVAHLSAFGATGTVGGGALIGYAGSTGNSTGDHMHVSRAYDGQPAPLILGGQQVMPATSSPGTQYYSVGPMPVAFSVTGVCGGMPAYYCPITLRFSCAGADAGTFCATLDGAPVTTGITVSAPGAHTLVLAASLGGVPYSRQVTFTVASPPAPGLEPVFRFYKPGGGTHFLTPSHDERDGVIARWSGVYRYEGVAYWTNPAANMQPLYRFYNGRSQSHFYTASAQERDTVRATWSNVYTYEGETYRVSTVPAVGAVTVYRFYNLKNGSHFYTASAEERDTVISQWPGVYRFEGPAYWLGQ